MERMDKWMTQRRRSPAEAVAPAVQSLFSYSSYLVDVQGLHGVFDQLNVDLSLLWLQLLVGNKLSLCKRKEST